MQPSNNVSQALSSNNGAPSSSILQFSDQSSFSASSLKSSSVGRNGAGATMPALDAGVEKTGAQASLFCASAFILQFPDGAYLHRFDCGVWVSHDLQRAKLFHKLDGLQSLAAMYHAKICRVICDGEGRNLRLALMPRTR